MSLFSKDRERELLEQEIETEGYRTLLGQLQHQKPIFNRFNSWMDMVKFMRDEASPESDQDKVLRSILRAYRKDQDPHWQTILLVSLWPTLEAVYFKKRKWDHDPDDLWQNLVWMFFIVVSRFKVEDRSRRVARKIINDTAHRLYDEYQRLWKQSEIESPTNGDELEYLAGGVAGTEFKEVEMREAQEAEVEKLRSYCKDGSIREDDFVLLVATRVYEQRLVDYAREAGIPYEYARRRRLQVEAKIARKEKEKQEKENFFPDD